MRMSGLCKVEMSGFIQGGRRDGTGANRVERERAGTVEGVAASLRDCIRKRSVVFCPSRETKPLSHQLRPITMKNPHGTTRFGTSAVHSATRGRPRREMRFIGLLFFIGVTLGVLLISGCLGGSQNQSGVTGHVAILNWNPSTSAVIGYRVYRSTQSGTGYALMTPTLVSGTSFRDSTVAKGQTYFYVITSVDANFHESGFSNEVFATIPSS